MKACTMAAMIVLLPAALRAQSRDLEGARPLRARVHVTTASAAGDTITIGYSVDNLVTGDEELTGFLLSTPAGVLRMPKPAKRQWFMSSRYRGRAISQWMVFDTALVRPGESTGELRLVARGVPDFVRYWAVPDLTAHPVDVDDDPARDDRLIFSDTGVTVGIVPVPSGATPRSLVARLQGLSGTACGQLGWITKAGVCHSLDVKLMNAQRAIENGSPGVAGAELSAFLNELDAQHGDPPGKAVSDEAYALLRLNVLHLLRQF